MSELHVRVRVAGEEYALPVGGVREVAEYGGVTPIPGSPARIIGALNLRGQVLPVIDLAVAFKIAGEAGPTRIVIAEGAGLQAGLAVEDVLDVAELSDSGEEADSPYLSRTVVSAGSLVGVVDIGALIQPEGLE